MENIKVTLNDLNKDFLCLEVSRTIAVAVNNSNIITDINNRGCDFLSSTKQEIIDNNFFNIFIASINDITSDDGMPEHFETTLTTKDGNNHILDWQTIPLGSTDKQVSGYICFGNEITDLKRMVSELDDYNKRLEEVMLSRISELAEINEKLKYEVRGRILAEKRLGLKALIIEKAPEVIFMIDGTGKIIFANEAACRAYDFDIHELINMNFCQLIPEDELPGVEDALKSLREGYVVEVEATHLRKNNIEFPVKMRFVNTDTTHGKFTICEVVHTHSE